MSWIGNSRAAAVQARGQGSMPRAVEATLRPARRADDEFAVAAPFVPGMRFGIFIAPFHPNRENPDLALRRDFELVEWLDQLGYDEASLGEHHSARYVTPRFQQLNVNRDASMRWAAANRPTFIGAMGDAINREIQKHVAEQKEKQERGAS